ncbi:MAG: hypothetical protein ABWK00_06740 [Desulfurococcaceae archaeon]
MALMDVVLGLLALVALACALYFVPLALVRRSRKASGGPFSRAPFTSGVLQPGQLHRYVASMAALLSVLLSTEGMVLVAIFTDLSTPVAAYLALGVTAVALMSLSLLGA